MHMSLCLDGFFISMTIICCQMLDWQESSPCLLPLASKGGCRHGVELELAARRIRLQLHSAADSSIVHDQHRGRFSDLPPNMLKPAANQAFGGK